VKENGFLAMDIGNIDHTKLPRALSDTIHDLRERQDAQSMYTYHTDEPRHDHSRDRGSK
jgi:hypothetical protein